MGLKHPEVNPLRTSTETRKEGSTVGLWLARLAGALLNTTLGEGGRWDAQTGSRGNKGNGARLQLRHFLLFVIV